ncbi:MAG: M48 family metalloprotease [Helicobacteraceae bacterium]|jgi:Zn-dependent protease with chaperone function|nr:M48 family metalloprotease [Helicobacteraceae bacterium]
MTYEKAQREKILAIFFLLIWAGGIGFFWYVSPETFPAPIWALLIPFTILLLVFFVRVKPEDLVESEEASKNDARKIDRAQAERMIIGGAKRSEKPAEKEENKINSAIGCLLIYLFLVCFFVMALEIEHISASSWAFLIGVPIVAAVISAIISNAAIRNTIYFLIAYGFLVYFIAISLEPEHISEPFWAILILTPIAAILLFALISKDFSHITRISSTNFRERQKASQETSRFLIFAFFGAIAVISAFAFVIFEMLFTFTNVSIRGEIFGLPIRSILLIFFIWIFIFVEFLITLSQIKDGRSVAEQLGARLVTAPNTTEEQRLLNVVYEMSLASGVPVPMSFILHGDAINAFAAGRGLEDSVVAVTEGALKFLTRDELQGVIAHEFSHILNGDMALNIKFMGALNGLSSLSQAGFRLMTKIATKKRSGSGNKGNGVAVILLIGGVLWLVGLAGYFFGLLIKSRLNREREFLADSSAVQFTRLNSGIAGALKKIGYQGSDIDSPKAETFSHFYFARGMEWRGGGELIDSHPPLETRIFALEPDWDGKFTPTRRVGESEFNASGEIGDFTAGFSGAFAADSAKTFAESETKDFVKFPLAADITPQKIARANRVIAEIPLFLHECALDSLRARWVIYALLLDDLEDLRAKQTQIVKNDIDFLEFKKICASLIDLSRENYLDLALLCAPSLRLLTKAQYIKFSYLAKGLIEADGELSAREFTLKYAIFYPLDIFFGIKPAPKETFNSIAEIEGAAETILSAIALSQVAAEDQAKELLRGVEPDLNYAENHSPSELMAAYDLAGQASQKTREEILTLAVKIASYAERGGAKAQHIDRGGFEDRVAISAKDREQIAPLAAALRLKSPF